MAFLLGLIPGLGGGGKVTRKTEMENSISALTEVITSTVVNSMTTCANEISLQQKFSANLVEGDVNITGVKMTGKIKSYASCKNDASVVSKIAQDAQAKVHQNATKQTDALFESLQGAVNEVGDAITSLTGGSKDIINSMKNKQDFQTKIADSISQNFIINVVNSIDAKQTYTFGTVKGNYNISQIEMDINAEAVSEAFMKTDVMRAVDQVSKLESSQKLDSKSSFGLFDAIKSLGMAGIIIAGLIAIAVVAGAVFFFVKMNPLNLLKNNTNANSNKGNGKTGSNIVTGVPAVMNKKP